MIVTVTETLATAVRNKNISYATQSKGKRRRELTGARRFMIGIVRFPMTRV
jgi:hypothetical protein